MIDKRLLDIFWDEKKSEEETEILSSVYFGKEKADLIDTFKEQLLNAILFDRFLGFAIVSIELTTTSLDISLISETFDFVNIQKCCKYLSSLTFNKSIIDRPWYQNPITATISLLKSELTSCLYKKICKKLRNYYV